MMLKKILSRMFTAYRRPPTISCRSRAGGGCCYSRYLVGCAQSTVEYLLPVVEVVLVVNDAEEDTQSNIHSLQTTTYYQLS